MPAKNAPIDPESSATCKGCNRAVYAKDLGKDGLCVLCKPAKPTPEPAPVDRDDV